MAVGLAVAAGALSSCASDNVVLSGALRPVDTRLAPLDLGADASGVEYTLAEYTKARAQFAHGGPASLVSDGRMYEIHRGSVLIGTLEIATVKQPVDLSSEATRSSIVNGVMIGAYLNLNVDGFAVASSSVGNESLYAWFAPETFEVLQIRGSNLSPEAILAAIVSYQRTQGLKPLPGGGRVTSQVGA